MGIDLKHAKYAELMKAALDSPEPESEVLGPDGTGFRVTKHPEPGVRMRIVPVGGESDAPTITMWEPAGERPNRYPRQLPFVPDVSVSVTLFPGSMGTAVTWWGVEKAAAVIDKLVQDSTADGWAHAEGRGHAAIFPLQLVKLYRGAQTRLIVAGPMLGEGMVGLLEQEGGLSEEAV